MNRKQHIDQDYPIANREYKDGLFRMVFQEMVGKDIQTKRIVRSQ